MCFAFFDRSNGGGRYRGEKGEKPWEEGEIEERVLGLPNEEEEDPRPILWSIFGPWVKIPFYPSLKLNPCHFWRFWASPTGRHYFLDRSSANWEASTGRHYLLYRSTPTEKHRKKGNSSVWYFDHNFFIRTPIDSIKVVLDSYLSPLRLS